MSQLNPSEISSVLKEKIGSRRFNRLFSANIERSFFDVSEMLSSNNLTKISTISCLDNVGFSIVFITVSYTHLTLPTTPYV